jgi:hypothetical protein
MRRRRLALNHNEQFNKITINYEICLDNWIEKIKHEKN